MKGSGKFMRKASPVEYIGKNTLRYLCTHIQWGGRKYRTVGLSALQWLVLGGVHLPGFEWCLASFLERYFMFELLTETHVARKRSAFITASSDCLIRRKYDNPNCYMEDGFGKEKPFFLVVIIRDDIE